jgi:hypothetical protein
MIRPDLNELIQMRDQDLYRALHSYMRVEVA